MFEYDVPENHHITISRDPGHLFTLTVGLLGDLAAQINSHEVETTRVAELRNDLKFSARFFDAYCEAKLSADLDPYLLLLGSASYYLCGLPGSSDVLSKRLAYQGLDVGGAGLEGILLWFLKGFFQDPVSPSRTIYDKHIDKISRSAMEYFNEGTGIEMLFEGSDNLRKNAYVYGTPRELLFADVIAALIKKRVQNSTWYGLPRYSALSPATWLPTLQKPSFVRELWPAQQLLGERHIFSGSSGVVQMPTSAGKTRATEILIRSAFLSNRTSLAIIVAPFRALCHEIRDRLISAFQGESVSVEELSDVLQTDFEINAFFGKQQVLVVTPEKLLFVLRHAPEIAEKIGLLIYDEGHQFDSGIRGLTYELLLTSLNALVPRTVQKVLFSAVITNAEAVNLWLNSEGGEVVFGTNLIPTQRTIAFASWLDSLGSLEFVAQDNIDEKEFFVPRLIEQHTLQQMPRERKERLFPEKGNGRSVALYLGLKLMPKGSVAIFCGTKRTAVNLCEMLVETFRRKLPLRAPIELSDWNEVNRLSFLHECNLGSDASATQSAKLGVFAHHGNTPQGVRLAIEHALKEGSVRFVICTSTLAQGVNLPIRYLIFTSVYQAGEPIKARDFHNLIGRAGRSGMHTEGSVLFADTEIYDQRASRHEGWRWLQVKKLLKPENSDPCASSLLSIFQPLQSADGKMQFTWEPLHFVQTYIKDSSAFTDYADKLAARHSGAGFTKASLEFQIETKIKIISAVENYLLAHWDDSETVTPEDNVAKLAQGTLAYHLAEENVRANIIEVFKLLKENIQRRVPDALRRKAFGKTLYGVVDSLAIEAWVVQNLQKLVECQTEEELFLAIWPVLEDNISNEKFRKCTSKAVLRDMAIGWIEGRAFYDLFEMLNEANARFGNGPRARHPELEHAIEICENALAFDGMLAVSAITEIFELLRPDDENTPERLRKLQKRLKYGLASAAEIALYELGFSDRVISRDLTSIAGLASPNQKNKMVRAIERKEDQVREVLAKYPGYFTGILNKIIP